MLKGTNSYKSFIRGEESAFKEVFLSFKAFVFGIALRYTRCKDDAEDVFQETFIAVYEKRERYDPTYPLQPWIQKIAVNTALNYIRNRYKFKLVEDLEYFDSNISQELDLEVEDLSELKKKLLHFLGQLPEGYRVVFNLYAIDNLTHKEIAEYLNISEATSRSQLFKAKKMIKNLIEEKKYA